MRQPKKDAFLNTLREGATVKKAAETAGVSRATAYRERDADPDFAAEWEDAYDEGADVLEQEAFRRAVEGTQRPVFHKGIECGYIRELSDTLLIFLLKARRPERFRDNVKVEHTGKNDGPIQTETKRVVSLAEVVELAQQLGVPADRGAAG